MQVQLWSEAVNCSGFLENFIIKEVRKAPEIENWSEKRARRWFNKLAQLGRTGYITKKEKIKANLPTIGFL